MRRPRIFGVIDTMSKRWNLLLLRKHCPHILNRVGSARINRLEKVKSGLVRAAVQRAFESADGRSDGRVHIRERSRRHAGGKSGGIQLVIGMPYQSNIEGTFGGLGGTLAVQH